MLALAAGTEVIGMEGHSPIASAIARVVIGCSATACSRVPAGACSRPKDDFRVGICHAELEAKRAQQAVELGRVVTCDPQLVIRGSGEVQHLAHGRELVAHGREFVGIGTGKQRDRDQCLQLAAASCRVDLRREPGDDPGLAQPAHPVGCGVCAQADCSPQVTPRRSSISSEDTEDSAVYLVHGSDYRSFGRLWLVFTLDRVVPRRYERSAALVAGLVSGGAIATQFGAVSALLLETAVVAGPRRAAAAGLGVASVDLAYAALAGGAGAAARVGLASHEAELKAAATLALMFIAVRGLRSIIRDPARPRASASEPTIGATRRSLPAREQYLRFAALTAINPLTIVYFASVATSVSLGRVLSRFAFVIGAGGASAVWHLSLTLAAGHAGRRLTPAIQRVISIVGRLVVLAIAVRLALAA